MDLAATQVAAGSAHSDEGVTNWALAAANGRTDDKKTTRASSGTGPALEILRLSRLLF